MVPPDGTADLRSRLNPIIRPERWLGRTWQVSHGYDGTKVIVIRLASLSCGDVHVLRGVTAILKLGSIPIETHQREANVSPHDFMRERIPVENGMTRADVAARS